MHRLSCIVRAIAAGDGQAAGAGATANEARPAADKGPPFAESAGYLSGFAWPCNASPWIARRAI